MRRHLLFIMESSVLTFTGMLGSFWITFVVMTYVHDPAKAATLTVGICTVWSLIRGYFWRLWIARRSHHRSNEVTTESQIMEEDGGSLALRWHRQCVVAGYAGVADALDALFARGAYEHLAADSKHEPSNVTKLIVGQVLQRDAHGQRKYGVSLDRPDLTHSQWLQHMAEELMDGAHYALAAKREHRKELLTILARAMSSCYEGVLFGSSIEVGMTMLADAIRKEIEK